MKDLSNPQDLFWFCARTYLWLAKARRKTEVQNPVISTQKQIAIIAAINVGKPLSSKTRAKKVTSLLSFLSFVQIFIDRLGGRFSCAGKR
jgi:hypothetical protein